jgi:transcriptional regulator with XRE-family HTH domain
MNDNGAMQDRDSDGMSKEAIGRRLQISRECEGVSQAEFAERCGLARNTYNQYEKGVNKPTVDQALKIRAAWKLTLDWIYAGDPSALSHAIADKIASHPDRKLR